MTSNRNPLRRLAEFGQSAWLDYIARDLLEDGRLRRLIDEDGIAGVTSNPSIFEKALAGGTAYRDQLAALHRAGRSAAEIFETIAGEDVQRAADELRAVYETTEGRDGYVSLEVSPRLAHDAAGTVNEARRLWQRVARPNLMIKVPGTPAGTQAIEALITDGINVNVTLLFSRRAYREAAEAYQAGLARRLAAGREVRSLASVASFFVSRIDTRVDALLDTRPAGTPQARAHVAALRGRAAVANAKLAYAEFQEMSRTPRWRQLAAAGAHPQRLLWASTSTKSPAYRDVKYVEELIGPHTVNTLPLATIDAFRDHGEVHGTLTEGSSAATRCLRELHEVGIDFDTVTDELLVQGIELFTEAYDAVLHAVAASGR